MAGTPFLHGYQKSSFPPFIPLVFYIRIDITPQKTAFPGQILIRIECGEISMEIPVIVALLVTTDRVIGINLPPGITVGIHLIRIKVCQHIGVLTSQGRQVIQYITGTFAYQRKHRIHVFQLAKCAQYTKTFMTIPQFHQDCIPIHHICTDRSRQVFPFTHILSTYSPIIPVPINATGKHIKIGGGKNID